MKTLLLFLLLSISATNLISQNIRPVTDERKRDKVIVSPRGIYQFEEFKNGKVYFKNGKHTNVKLNYNYLHGEVEYIATNRDTLLIKNKEFVDRILIGDVPFYSQLRHGDMEVIGNFNDVLLAKKRFLTIKASSSNASDRKLTVSNDSSIPAGLWITYQNGEFQWQNTSSRPDYMYKTTYHLIDKNRNFHPARRAGFFKIYAKDQDVLSEFLRANDIDFNKEDHLKQLLQFCSEI